MIDLRTNARIVITQYTNPATGDVERRDYRWEGGNLIAVSRELMEMWIAPVVEGIFTVGPYRLRIIYDDPRQDFVFAMRNGWRAHLWHALYRCRARFERIYRRLIITAAVWGLASWQRNQAMIPTWRDVYALAAIVEMLTRWRKGLRR